MWSHVLLALKFQTTIAIFYVTILHLLEWCKHILRIRRSYLLISIDHRYFHTLWVWSYLIKSLSKSFWTWCIVFNVGVWISIEWMSKVLLARVLSAWLKLIWFIWCVLICMLVWVLIIFIVLWCESFKRSLGVTRRSPSFLKVAILKGWRIHFLFK